MKPTLVWNATDGMRCIVDGCVNTADGEDLKCSAHRPHVFGIWLGGGALSPLAEQCLDTWPDGSKLYSRAMLSSFVPWIADIKYFRDAYERGHYAGASDVARLAVLWEVGGIYLDVDVEVIKPDDLLAMHYDKQVMYVGREDNRWCCNAVIAAPPKHPIVGLLLDRYRATRFEDTFEGTVTGATMLTDAAVFAKPNQMVCMLDTDFFFPWHWADKDKPLEERRSKITQRTVTAHHWEGSWVKK